MHIIVGFPAGTAPDITGRIVAQSLSERIGQEIIVDNRPVAASSIAIETVARAPADGYTLLLALSSNVVNAALYTNLSFNIVRDITPVAFIGANPFVLVVTPSLPVKTLPEFIAYAKANPGKVNMASQGIGTPHVCGELLKLMTGITFTHVPYRTALMPDLLAGQVHFYFSAERSSTSKMGACAGWRSPARHALSCCRTCLRSENSCRAIRRSGG